MNKIDAILNLMSDARHEHSSVLSYKRSLRACKALELADEETKRVMLYLDYLDFDGKPYQWLLKDKK